MRIAIDAGHGMSNRTPGVFDPGATAGGILEADVALAYALALRAALELAGIATWLVRDSNDAPTPVGQRAARAAQAGCTAFVSLHLNAADSAAAHGIEVLYRFPKDLLLARALQARLVAATGFADRGAKVREDLAVLRFAAGPAALIELGFITNVTERAKMLAPAAQARIVAAIAAVIVDTFGAPPPPAAPAAASWRVEGKMSDFGGPADTGVSPSEGLALVGPKHLAIAAIRSLFLPTQPPGTTGLARRLNPEAWYVAARWPYDKLPPAERERWKAHLRASRATVTNPRTGRALAAIPVDWGPNEEETGRVADLSPGLARALGLETDDEVIVTVPVPPVHAD